MALNKYIEKLLDKLYDKLYDNKFMYILFDSKFSKVFGKIYNRVVLFCGIIGCLYLILYMFVSPLYKPKNVECVDITFVSQTVDNQRQDFVRKNMLGVHANLTWYDNDIRLDVHKTNGSSESIIFTNVGGGHYLHNGRYDSMTYLIVNRNLLGWITSITLEFYDYEDNKYIFLYTAKLK